MLVGTCAGYSSGKPVSDLFWDFLDLGSSPKDMLKAAGPGGQNSADLGSFIDPGRPPCVDSGLRRPGHALVNSCHSHHGWQGKALLHLADLNIFTGFW